MPPIREFRGDVPPEVVQVLARMLAKDRDKRFQTPAEVADAVGPFATIGDLAALVARARRESQAPVPVAPDQAPQAEVATAESRSPSSATRFLQQIVDSASETAAGLTSPTVPQVAEECPHDHQPCAIGVFFVVAVLIWAFTRGGDRPGGTAGLPSRGTSALPDKPAVPPRPRATYLVLQWPADEGRTSATLEINGQVQDLAALALTSSAHEIRIALKTGDHKVAVQRLGYEPFEQTFTLADGKDTVLRPVWKLAVGQAFLPAEAKKEPPPEPMKEPPPVAKPEPPKRKPPEEEPLLKRRRSWPPRGRRPWARSRR